MLCPCFAGNTQITSLVLSVLSLCLTCSTFLFYHHEDYIDDRFEPDSPQQTRGINDPSMILIIPTTMVYLLINVPKISANGLLLAITPTLAVIMLIIEMILALIMSHFLIQKLSKNDELPGGFLLSIANYICPTGPVTKIGIINMLSNSYTVIKLTALIPIVLNVYANHYFTIPMCQKPDLFRCWDEQVIKNSACSYKMSESKILSPRPCSQDERPNQVLFTKCIPILIGTLVLSTIAGFAISYLIRKDKLDKLEGVIKPLINCLKQFIKRVICCECCKRRTHRNENMEMQITTGQLEQGEAIEPLGLLEHSANVEDQKNYTNKEMFRPLKFMNAHDPEKAVNEEVSITIDKKKIEKPIIMMKDMRRFLAPPVVIEKVQIYNKNGKCLNTNKNWLIIRIQLEEILIPKSLIGYSP